MVMASSSWSRAWVRAWVAAGSTVALPAVPGWRARTAASSIAVDRLVSAVDSPARAASTAARVCFLAGLGTSRVGSSATSA